MFTFATFILAACVGTGSASDADEICEDMCDELYRTCQYAAFPDLESCLEGCAYNREEGADVDSQLTCILEAGCDTFQIVECENAYGAESDE